MNILRRAAPDALLALVLFIAPLLIFFPQTLGGRTLIPAENLYQWEPYRSMAAQVGAPEPHNALYSDLILENYAWRSFVLEQVRQGQLPLWQPNILAGTPFLAAGQSLTLYPLSILYLILPLWLAYGWFTVAQLWIAGLCMAILVRVLGMNRPAALIGGLIYQLSSFFTVSAVFPMILAAAAWLPLELAMIHLVTSSGRRRTPFVIIGAAGLAMVALAGHVEALYFTLLVMAFYAGWRLLSGAVELRGVSLRDRVRPLAEQAGWLVTMVALGLALGAIQIVPAYELASRSFREGGATLDQVKGWAYPVRHILAFLMPNFYGSPSHHQILNVFTGQWTSVAVNSQGQPITTTEWGIKNYVEGAAYVGILPLVLAAGAVVQYVVRRIRRQASTDGSSPLVFIVLGALSLSFAFGTPTYDVLYYGLPNFNQSHSPFRWVWPLTLCIAALAAFLVESLSTKSGEASQQSNWVKWASRLSICTGAAILVTLVVVRLSYDAFAGLIERLFNGFALAPNAFLNANEFFSYEVLNVAIFALMLILTGIVFLLVNSQRGVATRWGTIRYWHIAAVIVIITDLWIAVWGLHPASDPKLLEAVPPSIQWLKDRRAERPLEPFRVMSYQTPGSTKTLNSNVLWLNGLEDASGYDSLLPAQYVEYMKVIMPQGDLPYNRISPIYEDHKDALDSPLLDLLGVRYVVSETEIDNPRWTQVYLDEAVRIYENVGAQSRAYTLPQQTVPIIYAVKPEAGLPSFADAAQVFDVRRNVLIAQDVNAGLVPPPPPDRPVVECNMVPAQCGDAYLPSDPKPASVTINRAGEIWVDADINTESWLVTTESYFPGWRAWVRPIGGANVEEKEIPVYLVDGNFRGVVLDAGRWTVRMKYSADTFKYGALISLLAVMLLVFMAGVWAWPRLYREEGQGHEARRVAKNAFTPILLNLFNKGIMFVLTFVSLRVLGPEGTGQYTYAVVIWGWFEILANFGLNTYLTREVARNRDQAGAHLANTTLLRLALTVIGIPLLIGFIAVRQTAVSPALDASTLWTLGLLYVGLFFATISTGLTALFYAFEKAEYPAAIQTVSAFLTVGLGVAALLSGFGIIGLAAVSLVVNISTVVILVALSRRVLNVRFTADAEKGSSWSLALRESFPLMLNHLLATLFFRIDVILLEALKGTIVVGWYRIVYTWVDTVGLIPSLFTLALFPRMSQQASADRPALKRAYILALKLMTLASVPMAIFTTLLAPMLVNILAGSEFLPHGAIALQIFIWAMTIGWLNSVTQYVIIALNRQRTLTIAFVVAAGFNLIANLIYIPIYSYIAASAITILSELVLWGVFYVVILSELGRINWLAALGRVWAAGALCAATAFGLASINVWLALAAGVLVYGAALAVIRPLDQPEWATVTGLLPERIRTRLASPQARIGS